MSSICQGLKNKADTSCMISNRLVEVENLLTNWLMCKVAFSITERILLPLGEICIAASFPQCKFDIVETTKVGWGHR